MKVLVLSEIKYSYGPTRKQQLVSRFPKEWQIFFLEPYKREKPNNFSPREVQANIQNVTVPFLKNFEGTLKTVFGNLLVRIIFYAVSALWIKRMLKRAGFDKPDVVIISNLYAVPYLHFKCPVIYDMNDDHMAFKNTPAWLYDYRELLYVLSGKIVVCSELLVELIPVPYRKKVVYIGNGVDVSAFISETNSAALMSQELSLAKSE